VCAYSSTEGILSAQVANRLVFMIACAGVFVALVLGLAHIAGA
jgi:hypothetical protein